MTVFYITRLTSPISSATLLWGATIQSLPSANTITATNRSSSPLQPRPLMSLHGVPGTAITATNGLLRPLPSLSDPFPSSSLSQARPRPLSSRRCPSHVTSLHCSSHGLSRHVTAHVTSHHCPGHTTSLSDSQSLASHHCSGHVTV